MKNLAQSCFENAALRQELLANIYAMLKLLAHRDQFVLQSQGNENPEKESQKLIAETQGSSEVPDYSLNSKSICGTA